MNTWNIFDFSMKPLVSIIIPTYNSARFLKRCLDSITRQSYPQIEIIIVDNYSRDRTREIAARYTDRIYRRGPERSAQVNYGVAKARGEYVYKVDSDFALERKVVSQAVAQARRGADAVVIHNTPDAAVSWLARVRKFEVDMYKYNLGHSAARFVRKDVFEKIGGFNEKITAGEDYDFQNRLNRAGYKTGFIKAEALHLGEPVAYWPYMKKCYRYGRDFRHYLAANPDEHRRQLNFVRPEHLHNLGRFARHPILATGFMFYYVSKAFFGGWGLLAGKLGSAPANRKIN